MKQNRKILPLFGLCAVFLLGITFPRIAGLVQDLNIQKGSEEVVVDAKTLQLAMNSNLTILQKMNVIRNATSKVSLETAQKMDENEAGTELQTQIGEIIDQSDTLADLTGFGKNTYTEKKHLIQLLVYDQKSVIVWNFLLEDEKGDQLQILLDDDSGKVLGLTYATAENPVENQENWGSGKTGTSNNNYSSNTDTDSNLSKSARKNMAEAKNGVSSSVSDTDSLYNAQSKGKKYYKKIYGDGILSKYGYDSEDVEYIAYRIGDVYTTYLQQEMMGVALDGWTTSVNGETYEYIVVMENPKDDEDSEEVVISLTDTQMRINM